MRPARWEQRLRLSVRARVPCVLCEQKRPRLPVALSLSQAARNLQKKQTHKKREHGARAHRRGPVSEFRLTCGNFQYTHRKSVRRVLCAAEIWRQICTAGTAPGAEVRSPHSVAFWRGTLEQAVHSRGGPPAGVGADGMPGDHYQVVHRKPVRHVRAAAAAAAEPAGCCSRRCSASTRRRARMKSKRPTASSR